MTRLKSSFFKSKVGKATIASYKLKRKPIDSVPLFRPDMFSEDRAWLATLPFCYETDNLFFVPSGVDLNTPLNKQRRGVVTFPNRNFKKQALINSLEKFNKTIVHGNYPASKVTIGNKIINLDSSKSNTLSCVVFEEATGKVLDVLSVEKSKKLYN
jgi:hypothetical protein